MSELVKKGIRLKYRKSYLGILWSLIEPLMSTVVMVIVFGTLFNNRSPSYPLYIISGRLMYSFFSEGTKNASKSLRNNAAMIKKVYVPKLLYPLSSVLYTFVIFFISLFVLVGVDIYCKVVPTVYIFMFIPVILIHLLLTFGVGLILSVLDIFFRDIEYIWNVLLMVIMYMSAIFYYPERIQESRYAFILNCNPVYQVIHAARCCLLSEPFDVMGILYALACSLVLVVFGVILYNKTKDKFILHI